MKPILWTTIALLVMQLAPAATAQTRRADPALIEQGRHLVTAGDCAACHSPSMAGGDPIVSPMGSIYASNITPDRTTGIGSWTVEQLSDALRKGKSPRGHLYPAMPYTSYTGLDDEQVRAIYAYLMLAVKPVSKKAPDTDLPFPFVRPAMAVWNALFLDVGHPTGAIDVDGAQEQRGRLLVETLGHCTACHSSRGSLMQQDASRHLAGAMFGGWWAPNITPHEDGIGGWSDVRLMQFLQTGHTDKAVAAGEMATVVSRSLSQLPQQDIAALVAYLRKVPAMASEQSAKPDEGPRGGLQVAMIEPAGMTDADAMLQHDTTQGNLLYQSACASCHGARGQGSVGLDHPSLLRIDSVRSPHAATLVQVIAHGVDRQVGNRHVLMPGFADSMEPVQIAAVANYVRTGFGGVQSDLDAAQVGVILGGKSNASWIIRNAHWLSILGIVVLVLVLVLAGWAVTRALRRRGSGRA